MLSKVNACAIKGIDGFLVSVEVDIAPGMPTLSVVGLPDTEVKESKERVIAALRNSGFDFPLKRITVNLSPAEQRKSGTQFDLPIAVGILAASEQLSPATRRQLDKYLFMGELALDGALRPCAGVLPMLISTKSAGKTAVIPPAERAGRKHFFRSVYYPAYIAEPGRFFGRQTAAGSCRVKFYSPAGRGTGPRAGFL